MTDTLPPTSVQAVLFDFGLVLSGPADPAVWAAMLATTRLNEAAFHAAYWAYRHEYDRGALTGRAYWQAVGDHAGTALTPSNINDLINLDTELWTQLNIPMMEWAAQLQREGIRTGILSNIGDAIAEGICAKLPWLAGFYHCTWSHALSMAKPEPEIYLRTAAALRTEPAFILFIDDREENIAAAVAVGMQAIRYTSHAVFIAEMEARGLGWLLLAGDPDRPAPAHPWSDAQRPE